MNSPQAQFRSEKELCAAWVQIKNSPVFERAVTFARAEFLQSAPTPDMTKGAELLIHILTTMSDSEPGVFQFPSSGIIHNVEKMPDDPRKPIPTPKKAS